MGDVWVGTKAVLLLAEGQWRGSGRGSTEVGGAWEDGRLGRGGRGTGEEDLGLETMSDVFTSQAGRGKRERECGRNAVHVEKGRGVQGASHLRSTV